MLTSKSGGILYFRVQSMFASGLGVTQSGLMGNIYFLGPGVNTKKSRISPVSTTWVKIIRLGSDNKYISIL